MNKLPAPTSNNLGNNGGLISKIPTMQQGNSQFMQKNPQFGTAPARTGANLGGSSFGNWLINAQPNTGPVQRTDAQIQQDNANIINKQNGSTSTQPQGSTYTPSTPTSSGTPQYTPTGTGYVDKNGQYQSGSSANPPAVNNGGSSNTPTPVNTPATPYGQSYGGQINIGQGNGAGNPGFYQNWLQNVAQNQTPAVTASYNDLRNFQNASPYMLNDVRNNPNVASEISVGRGAALGSTLANEEANKLGTYNAALSGQSQQVGASENAAGLGLTQQGQQLNALQGAGSLTAPHFNGYVAIDPTTGQPIGGNGAGNAAFMGGQINNRESQGATYQANDAVVKALNGSDGNSGMVGDFNEALKSSGLNSGNINFGNAWNQGLSLNSSGPYAALQTNFGNILQQYAKVLGTQKVNDLISSSNNATIADFFNSLNSQVQNIQSGLQTAGQSTQQVDVQALRTKYNY